MDLLASSALPSPTKGRARSPTDPRMPCSRILKAGAPPVVRCTPAPKGENQPVPKIKLMITQPMLVCIADAHSCKDPIGQVPRFLGGLKGGK